MTTEPYRGPTVVAFASPVAIVVNDTSWRRDVCRSSSGGIQAFGQNHGADADQVIGMYNRKMPSSMIRRKSQSTADLFHLKPQPPPSTPVGSLDAGLASSIDRCGQHPLVQQQQQKNKLHVEERPAGVPSAESLTISVQHQRTAALGLTGHVSGATIFADPIHSSTPLNHMEVDEFSVVRQPAHRERRFRRLFRNVPTTEILLCRFSCAYVSDLGLLLQGHLYISNNWICFHSNIFGIEKIIEIPVETVISVSKAHTAKIIPNAVKVKTHGKYYLFGSLISRDNTYRLLISVTARNGADADSGNVAIHDVIVKEEERIIGIGDADDDVSSMSSLSSISSCDSSSDDGDGPPILVAAAAASDGSRRISQPLLEKRLFHLNKNAAGSTLFRHTCRGTIAQRILPKFSVHGLITWFFSLPKIFIILLFCVGLLAFLFICATFLTVRLIYIQNPRIFWMDFMSWSSAREMQKFALPRESLETMDTTIDCTLKLVNEAKTQLETLKLQVRNLIIDITNTNSQPGSHTRA